MSFEIVKPALDVGVQTNQLDAHQRFWEDEVGLDYEHLLKLGGGVHQHRYRLHGAVLKVNSHRDPLPDSPTGFRRIAILDESLRETTVNVTGEQAGVQPLEAQVGDPVATETPDRTPVDLVPGLGGGTRTAIRLEATDAAATAAVLERGLGGVRSRTTCLFGESRVEVVETPGRPPTGDRDGTGIRYLTIQVRDVRAAHAHALDHGLTEGLAPLRFGDVAFISFVRLPDGDWVELSQRASLTGPLPDVTG